jgi:hypothetical protein
MSRAVSLILFFASFAAAEELPPPEVTTPPPWIPYYAVPGPSPSEIQSLEDQGRRNRHTGGILMLTGGVVATAGLGMWIGGAAWDDNCARPNHHHNDLSCGSEALAISGAVVNLAGSALFLSGVLVYLRGGEDLSHARALKHQLWNPISIQPSIGPNGAALSLRFEN